MKIIKYICTIVFVLISINAFCEENKNDSIIFYKLQNATHDSTRIDIYNELSMYYVDSAGNKAIDYAQIAIELAEKHNYEYKLADSYIRLGNAYFAKNDYSKALENAIKAEKFALKNNNYYQLYRVYNNFGIIYLRTQNFEFAKINLYKALEYSELLRTSQSTYNTNIHVNININIGNYFLKIEDFDKSLSHFNEALQAIGENPTLYASKASILNNIGHIYTKKKEYENALKIYEQSYIYFCKLNHNRGKAITLNNIADQLILLKKYNEAEKYIYQADSIHKLMDDKYSQAYLYENTYNLFYQQKQYDKAIYYLEKHHATNNAIYNQELNNTISELKVKHDHEKLSLENKNKDAKIKQQQKLNTVLYIGISGLSIMVIIIIIILAQKSKLNKKLISKNIEIKNNLDYSRKIQLASMNLGNQNIRYDYFILDKPRDRVGGDFYFIHHTTEKDFFILADATGHGISGGFLSVIGIQYIKHAIDKFDNVKDIYKSLNYNLFNNITSSKNLKNESICISIISIDNNNKLSFIGSKQKLWIKRKNQELIEYKSARETLGLNCETNEIEQEIQLINEDIIYMSSDGYPDQFGGKNNTKYKYSRFRNLLNTIDNENFKSAKEILDNEIINWQNLEKQTDDILVIGIKI